jgi:hypothetical protein
MVQGFKIMGQKHLNSLSLPVLTERLKKLKQVIKKTKERRDKQLAIVMNDQGPAAVTKSQIENLSRAELKKFVEERDLKISAYLDRRGQRVQVIRQLDVDIRVLLHQETKTQKAWERNYLIHIKNLSKKK